MKTLFYRDIFNAAKDMHLKYGRGQIIAGVAALGVGQVHITVQTPGRKPREVTALYDGKTLSIYGKSRRVCLVGGEE